jgi:hypothetical protein
MQKTNYLFDCEWSTIMFTHAWDQVVLNHANSENIVFQRVFRFFDTPCTYIRSLKSTNAASFILIEFLDCGRISSNLDARKLMNINTWYNGVFAISYRLEHRRLRQSTQKWRKYNQNMRMTLRYEKNYRYTSPVLFFELKGERKPSYSQVWIT